MDDETSRLSAYLEQPAYITSFGLQQSEGSIAQEDVSANFNLKSTQNILKKIELEDKIKTARIFSPNPKKKLKTTDKKTIKSPRLMSREAV